MERHGSRRKQNMIFTRHTISKQPVQHAGSPEIPPASMESIFRISVNCTKPASFHLPAIPCSNRHCCLPPRTGIPYWSQAIISAIFSHWDNTSTCVPQCLAWLYVIHIRARLHITSNQPFLPEPHSCPYPFFRFDSIQKRRFRLTVNPRNSLHHPLLLLPCSAVDRHSLSLSNLFPQLLLLLYRTHTDQTFHPLQFILARPTELFSCSCSTKATRTHRRYHRRRNQQHSIVSFSFCATAAYNYQTPKMLYRIVIAAQLVPSRSDLLAGCGKAVRKIEILRAIHRLPIGRVSSGKL